MKMERRDIYLYGCMSLFALLLIIGCTALVPNIASKWAIGSMLLVFTFVYDLTLGPICFALIAEVSSTRLRSKTNVLARSGYNVGGIVVNLATTFNLHQSQLAGIGVQRQAFSGQLRAPSA